MGATHTATRRRKRSLGGQGGHTCARLRPAGGDLVVSAVLRAQEPGAPAGGRAAGSGALGGTFGTSFSPPCRPDGAAVAELAAAAFPGRRASEGHGRAGPSPAVTPGSEWVIYVDLCGHPRRQGPEGAGEVHRDVDGPGSSQGSVP